MHTKLIDTQTAFIYYFCCYRRGLLVIKFDFLFSSGNWAVLDIFILQVRTVYT